MNKKTKQTTPTVFRSAPEKIEHDYKVKLRKPPTPDDFHTWAHSNLIGRNDLGSGKNWVVELNANGKVYLLARETVTSLRVVGVFDKPTKSMLIDLGLVEPDKV